ncbi:MAG TPA: hypothetical protein DER68_02495 [Ruminococcaceae bacterium]|nr:hypothetical protein [Oscillospiraceae bacterium]
MTREEFNSLCQNCCSRKSISECLFADAEEGFIDTSAESDGSRGIAFSKRKMMVNFDGTIKIVAYKKIRSIHIIGSLEGAFADELEISGEHSRLRITDFSLDKHILKQIIEGLREGLTEPIAANYEKKEPPAAEENSFVSEEKNEVIERADFDDKSDNIPENAQNIPENDGILHEYDDKIEWLSSAPDITHDEKIEWLSSMTAEEAAPVIPEADFTEETEMREQIEQMSREETLGFLSKTLGEINGNDGAFEYNQERETAPEAASQDIGESEMREQIGQMSREETLGFLSKTLGEINGGAAYFEESAVDDKPFFPTTQTAVIPENALPPKPIIEKIAAQNPPAEKPPAPAAARENGELSKEPIWGDIYIKASKSLRELCENGRLSMDIIEKELRERLLESAKSFADIVKDEQKIPKTLVPKIAELKNAADHFDEYFSHGEDVGVRVMFFMLFQMLCYSDRIAENPETKERLNDFFRRFGTAGITLSMLDARG